MEETEPKAKLAILYRIGQWIIFALAVMNALLSRLSLDYISVPGVNKASIYGSVAASTIAAILLFPIIFWRLPKQIRRATHGLFITSFLFFVFAFGNAITLYNRTPAGIQEAAERAKRDAEEAKERADSEQFRAEEEQRHAEFQERLEARSPSCDDTGDIERAIKERLKDPASAVFNDIIYSKARDRACVVYNAKNSFGGYGEPARAELKCGGDGWTVVNMESLCDDPNWLEFAAASDIEKEKIVTARRKEWDELFLVARKAPNDFDIRDCRKTRGTFGRLVEEVVDLEHKAESEAITNDEKRLLADKRRTIAAIKAGAAKGICAAERPE